MISKVRDARLMLKFLRGVWDSPHRDVLSVLPRFCEENKDELEKMVEDSDSGLHLYPFPPPASPGNDPSAEESEEAEEALESFLSYCQEAPPRCQPRLDRIEAAGLVEHFLVGIEGMLLDGPSDHVKFINMFWDKNRKRLEAAGNEHKLD